MSLKNAEGAMMKAGAGLQTAQSYGLAFLQARATSMGGVTVKRGIACCRFHSRLNGGIFSMICVLIQCLSFCGVFLVNGLVNFKNVMCRVVIVVIVSVVSWLPWLKR